MQSLGQIRSLLGEYGLSPRRSLGQNFLIDQNHLRGLIERAGVAPGDVVLEVGPGTGTLTEALLDAKAEVVAAELDRGLCAILRDRLGGHSGFTLVEGDCFGSKRRISSSLLEPLRGRRFKLVANLPYGCATPLLIALLLEVPACVGAWVTIQREVGERLLSGPGSRAYGPVGVARWAVAEGSIFAKVPRTCFWPAPEIESVMIELIRRPEPLSEDPAGLLAFSQRAFGTRRKQLGAVFGRATIWPEGVTGQMRIEELDPRSIDRLRCVVV